MKLSDLFEATGEPFSYYPGLVTQFDISVCACVFLCFIGWKTLPGEDGWRSFNVSEIQKRTGLTVKEQATARKQLKQLGLIEDKYARLTHKLLIRLTGGGHTPKEQMAISNFWGSHLPKEQMGKCPNGVSSIDKEADKRGRERSISSQVVEYWNTKTQLPHVKVLSPGRAKALKARLADTFFRDNWKGAIDRMVASSFCLGANDHNWKADFDFFLKPDSVAKISEGKYDNKPKPAINPL